MSEQFEKTRKYAMSKPQAQSLWDKVVVELPTSYHLSDLVERRSVLGDHIYKTYFFGVYRDDGTRSIFTILCPEDWKEIKDFCSAMADKPDYSSKGFWTGVGQLTEEEYRKQAQDRNETHQTSDGSYW